MQRLAQELSRLKDEFRHRRLKLPLGVDFTSNDYLGLAKHPALRQAVFEALLQPLPCFGLNEVSCLNFVKELV